MAGLMDLASGVGGGLGSLLGYFMGSGDRQQALDSLNAIKGEYAGLNPQIAAQQSGASMAGANPEDRAMQLEALKQLQGIYQNGGMDAQAKADMYAAQQAANQNAQALNSGLMNRLAVTGQASSPAALAMQQMNSQNAANQAAQQGLNAQAAGEMRAMGALQGYGQMAGNLGSEDNAISRFNAQLATQNNQFNAGQRQNAAQQSFGNSYATAQGKAGADKDVSNYYSNDAQKMQQMGQGVGAGLGAAAGALGGGF